MDNLEKQKRILNKIIGNRNKIQVYDRSAKSSKMIPKSGSSIKSANNSSRATRNASSFTQRQNKKGCGSCSRNRKSNG